MRMNQEPLNVSLSMSNRTFFKRYAAIYGLSGTIGSTPETEPTNDETQS